MTKCLRILVGVAACVAGCTPSYRVHINTYAEPDATVSPSASIYVASEPNAANPILSRQIEARMADLLRGYGYRPAATAEAADYTVTYRAGFDSESIVDYAPVGGPSWGLYGGYYGGHYGRRGFGHTTYIPYIDTIYIHWLRMKLFRADGQAPAEESLVWIGEALTGTDDPDLREAINYLLAGCLEYLGRDTNEWVVTRIRRDDPRIVDIMGPVDGGETGVE